jgi:hypothetical protein
LLWQPATLPFVFMGFVWSSPWTAIISSKSINQLIFLMKCGVLWRTVWVVGCLAQLKWLMLLFMKFDLGLAVV